MKTIGLLGGMSWESSAEYYRFINEAARDRLGGLHSAESVMFSFDFAEIEALQRAGRWEEAAERLAGAARGMERAGAEILVLCTNTMHRLADRGPDQGRGHRDGGAPGHAVHDGRGLLPRPPRGPARGRCRGRHPRLHGDRAPGRCRGQPPVFDTTRIHAEAAVDLALA